MSRIHRLRVAAAGLPGGAVLGLMMLFMMITATAQAMPISRPGVPIDADSSLGLKPAAWQCFQFGNCVWRPNAYFQPQARGGYRYAPPPRRYNRPRYRRD